MATHSQGAFGRMLFEAGGGTPTFNANSKRVEFLYEDISLRRRIIGKRRGIRGRLSRASERGREGLRQVRGRIAMYLTPNIVERLLVDDTDDTTNIQMLGMTQTSGDVHDLTEPFVLPSFAIMIDREQGVFVYQDCKLDWLSISARAPQQGERGEPELVLLTLGIIGTTESTADPWPGTAEALPTASLIDAPYTIFDSDTGVTLFGEVRPVEELRLTWRHFLEAKAVNSLEVHSLRPRDREIQIYAKIPWNSTTADIHTTALAGAVGTIKFTNSTVSTLFTFANLQQEIKSPNVRGKTQTFYEIFAEAGSLGDPATAANREIQITNDNTA
jgi:hypothetical protein